MGTQLNPGGSPWVRFALALTFVGAASTAHGQQTIFLLRHAERVEYQSADGVLSESGKERARSLARLLADAGVTAIYTSERIRTIQTAEPLAQILGKMPTPVGGPDQVAATLRLVRERDSDGIVAIIGHSDSVPLFLKALGYSRDVVIGPREHDDLFVIVPAAAGQPTVLRLNY